MQNSKQQIKPNKLYVLIIFFYVISAIAFESTPETARISTIAIYLVFFAGMMFAFSRQKLVINIYMISLVCLLIYALIMTFPSTASSSMGLTIVYWLFTCTVLCVVIFWLISDKAEIVYAILTANIVGSIILVYRIIKVYGGLSAIFSIASSTGEFRIGALITNENEIGLFMASGILSCIVFICTKKRKLSVKILLILAIAVLTVMALLTGSRQAILFVVGGTVLFLLLYFRNAQFMKKVLLYIFIIIAIVLLLYVMRMVPVFSTIYERFELLIGGLGGEKTYHTDVVREQMIKTGLNEFWENPLFGLGTGRSYVIFGTYTHNNFVEILASYGIIGFLLYYVPYVVLIINLWKYVRTRDIYAIYFLVYIVLQLVLGGVAWVNYYSRHTQLITAAAWGYLIYQSNQKKEKIKGEDI